MSYVLAFTDRALDDLRGLDIWLQEETLDELDRLAETPPLPRRRHLGAVVHDIVRERNECRYYVFISLLPDAATNELRVIELGFFISKQE